MDKVIIFARVSTAIQDNSQQTNDLTSMALADGYSADQIIIIEEKESAVKLDYDQRQGIKRMIDTIDTECIKCVYIWEVSRLARREDVGWQVLMHLKDHGVNLKVYKESISWLNADGSINESARIAFSIFFSFASSEADKFRARSARGRANRAKANKSMGWCLFGYERDHDGNTIINQQEAEFINRMYTKYANENIGAERLMQWACEVGYPMSLHQVQIILKNPAYRGSHGWQSKYKEITYPRIINEELWQRVETKRLSKNLQASKYKKWHHLSDKLCRCPQCGDWMVSSARFYVCRARKMGRCASELHVTAKDVDFVAWRVAEPIAKIIAMEDTQMAEKQDLAEKKELLAKLSVLNESKQAHDEKVNRIEELYIANGDRSKYNRNMAKANEEFAQIMQKIQTINHSISLINRRLEEYAKGVANSLYGAWDSINDELSDDEKSKIIHQVIKAIHVTRENHYVTYRIIDVRGTEQTYRIKTNHKKNIWEYYDKRNDTWISYDFGQK